MGEEHFCCGEKGDEGTPSLGSRVLQPLQVSTLFHDAQNIEVIYQVTQIFFRGVSN
ncbi:MAG: hypothetical protein DF168_01259 [Candidatus Moanabacter tarae]|uniref:Uncharacterized protein n=1 Tax=Candidatus Moanibacter tarae TaxID=2200854 RepID=A0A2Z4ACZ5_9BACT|nr:MAG: hypothetical protein DF168_01259 [Candidatus Moanabacter tarae]